MELNQVANSFGVDNGNGNFHNPIYDVLIFFIRFGDEDSTAGKIAGRFVCNGGAPSAGTVIEVVAVVAGVLTILCVGSFIISSSQSCFLFVFDRFFEFV